jgi:hypothetical protein
LTNSEALRSVRPRVVFGKIPLSSWGDDESNRLVRRLKKRPSIALAALAVAEEVPVDDDDDDEVDDDDDEVDDDDVYDDDVGADGEIRISDGRKSKEFNIHDWLELEVKFWKLPWTK